MNTNNRNIKIGLFDYYVVPAIEMIQNSVKYYILSLNANEVKSIGAYLPVNYNKVENKYMDIALTDERISPSDLIQDNSKSSFNRKLDDKKVDKIFEYAKKDKNAIFPNSIILASQVKNTSLIENERVSPCDFNGKEVENFNALSGTYFYNNKLYIPIIKDSILIVDGQHRIAGLSKLTETERMKIELPITLVAGQTNAVLSSMFYKINSTQKPVNPSILEYMTNLFIDELSEAKMFQEYIRILHDNLNSPLHDEIKMFGTGKGLISFATLHSSLMNMTVKATKRSRQIPIFAPLYQNEKKHYLILNLIVFYFNTLRKTFHATDNINDWNYDIVFTKTIGIVALLQLFPRILLKIIDDTYKVQTAESLESIVEHDFDSLIKQLRNIDTKPYEKAGSMGISKALRDKIIAELKLEKYDHEFAKKLVWMESFYI